MIYDVIYVICYMIYDMMRNVLSKSIIYTNESCKYYSCKVFGGNKEMYYKYLHRLLWNYILLRSIGAVMYCC